MAHEVHRVNDANDAIDVATETLKKAGYGVYQIRSARRVGYNKWIVTVNTLLTPVVIEMDDNGKVLEVRNE